MFWELLLPDVERNGSIWVLVLVAETEFNVMDTQRDLSKALTLTFALLVVPRPHSFLGL